MTKLAKLKESIFSIFKKSEIDLEDPVKKEMETLFGDLDLDDSGNDGGKVALALDKLAEIVERIESGKAKDDEPSKPIKADEFDERYKALTSKFESLEKQIEEEKQSGQTAKFNKVFASGVKEGKVAKGQKEELEKTFNGNPSLLDYHLGQLAKDRFVGGKLKDDKSDEEIKKATLKQEQETRLSAFDPEIVKMSELRN